MSARLAILGAFVLALGIGLLFGAELANGAVRGAGWGAAIYGSVQLVLAAVLRWRERALRIRPPFSAAAVQQRVIRRELTAAEGAWILDRLEEP